MGVLACGRPACDNIMCDDLILDGTDDQQYACWECLDELRKYNSTLGDELLSEAELHQRIVDFMNTPRRTYEVGRSSDLFEKVLRLTNRHEP